MRVLVAGATGYLGGFVVKEFLARGDATRALGRSSGKLASARAAGAETVVAEVTRPETLAGVCDDVDAVVSSIGITRQRDGLTYDDVDYRGNLALLNEARRARVRKFVYVSVFDPPGTEKLLVVRAKRAFASALKASGIDFAVLYPTGYFSDMDAFLDMARKGRAYTFGRGTCRINPIHGADVAAACVDAIAGNQRAIALGGPDVLTHDEIARLAFDVLGARPRVTHVPMFVPRSIRACAQLLTPARVRGPLEFLLTVLTRDMVAPPSGRRGLADHYRESVARDD